jgi:hypothetical protein
MTYKHALESYGVWYLTSFFDKLTARLVESLSYRQASTTKPRLRNS